MFSRPIVTGVGDNLCPRLVLGETINSTTGEWSASEGTTELASDYFIPVDFSVNPYYTLSYNYSALPAAGSKRTMIFAYNGAKDFVGRTTGTNSSKRTLNAASFTEGTPAGTGDPAYLRVRLYYAAFSEADAAVLKMQIVPGSDAKKYRARSLAFL